MARRPPPSFPIPNHNAISMQYLNSDGSSELIKPPYPAEWKLPTTRDGEKVDAKGPSRRKEALQVFCLMMILPIIYGGIAGFGIFLGHQHVSGNVLVYQLASINAGTSETHEWVLSLIPTALTIVLTLLGNLAAATLMSSIKSTYYAMEANRLANPALGPVTIRSFLAICVHHTFSLWDFFKIGGILYFLKGVVGILFTSGIASLLGFCFSYQYADGFLYIGGLTISFVASIAIALQLIGFVGGAIWAASIVFRLKHIRLDGPVPLGLVAAVDPALQSALIGLASGTTEALVLYMKSDVSNQELAMRYYADSKEGHLQLCLLSSDDSAPHYQQARCSAKVTYG